MKKLTAEWIAKAEADWISAKKLTGDKSLTDPACFHCQQAAEKFLKAVMEECELIIPKIHDLDELLTRLGVHAGPLRKYRKILNKLTEYAVDYRYPGIHASIRQARAALRWTREIRHEVRAILGIRTRRRKN